MGVRPWEMERYTPAELTAIRDWAKEKTKRK